MPRAFAPSKLRVLAWLLSIAVTVAATVAWGQGNNWRLTDLSTYQLFPLFGLLAFSLMWSHYIASALRQYFNIGREALSSYFEATSLAVLVAIFAHPGLLGWQLWKDGLGLPFGSYLEYAGPKLRIAVIMGIVSFFVFLAYEFRRKFSARSWWRFVSYASDVAMVLIFFHALRLGSNLQSGWFRGMWYFYGLTLAAALGYIYGRRFTRLPKRL